MLNTIDTFITNCYRSHMKSANNHKNQISRREPSYLSGFHAPSGLYFKESFFRYKLSPKIETSYMLSGASDLRFKAPIYELSYLAYKLERIASRIRNASFYVGLQACFEDLKDLLPTLNQLRCTWADQRHATRKEGRNKPVTHVKGGRK